MTIEAGVIVFPGSNCDRDCVRALKGMEGYRVREIWHRETELGGLDLVVLPGGFSYGDYLRPGAIARFSPIVREVTRFAERGGYVLGICNGFQILLEAGLLPGALIRNAGLRFICEPVPLECTNTNTPFTKKVPRNLTLPIAHGQGRYFIDETGRSKLEAEGRIVLRYAGGTNPNGSTNRIAGIVNEKGNVLGMMPHPERACEILIGSSEDGRSFFESLLQAA
ncbi:MAG: phosphoribosylformylglycinamidine synthase subunit PurQ [Candidatus Hydrogenedentota bacterium]|nr:MAG: phosphoribosylformylglycinamidine synthase subunit PurQ [Candidatus Hydrogenedentota bacterium]